MTDNPADKAVQDLAHVNLSLKDEVHYWTKELGATEEQLRAATARRADLNLFAAILNPPLRYQNAHL
jgi:hypothetical protein